MIERVSVAEMDYKSDRLGLKMDSFYWHGGDTTHQLMVFEITEDQDLHITVKTTNAIGSQRERAKTDEIKFVKLNLNQLIEFLNDAKQFVSESIVVKKLVGKK